MGLGRLAGTLLAKGAEKVATKGGKLSGAANVVSGISNAFLGNNKKASSLGKALVTGKNLLFGDESSRRSSMSSASSASPVSSIEQESAAEASAENNRMQTSLLRDISNKLGLILGVENSQLDAISNIELGAGGGGGEEGGDLFSTVVDLASNSLGKKAGKSLLGRAGRAVSSLGSRAASATGSAASRAASGIGRTALNIGAKGLGSTALKATGAIGGVAMGAYEGWSDWQNANKRLEAGEITEREANVEKSGAVGKGTGTATGAIAGAIAGQALIPIPVVGALIGGAVGGWLGGWLGEEAGEGLADAVLEEDPKALEQTVNQNIEETVEPVKPEENEELVETMTQASPEVQIAESLGMTKEDGTEKPDDAVSEGIVPAVKEAEKTSKLGGFGKVLPFLGPMGMLASTLLDSSEEGEKEDKGFMGSLMGGIGKIALAMNPVAALTGGIIDYFKEDKEEKVSDSEKEKQIIEAQTENQTISDLRDSIQETTSINAESNQNEKEILERTTQEASEQPKTNTTNMSSSPKKQSRIPSIPGRDNSGANLDVGNYDSLESIFFLDFMRHSLRGYNITSGIIK